MFGIGMPELMLIFVIALLIFGPKELPRIARTLGKAMGELRRASDELRDGIQREIDLAERADIPAPPPEVPPATTTPEGTSPAEEALSVPIAADTPTAISETPPGSVAADAPTETRIPAPGEQVGETAPKEKVEPAVTSAPSNVSEAEKAEKAPVDHQPQAKTASPTPPSQPVETRNA